MKSTALIVAAVLGIPSNGIAQTTQPETTAPPSTQQDIQQLPWAVQLGLRGVQAPMSVPLVDRVVLVPDAATYVDELGKWSLNGRWPVLIEDDILTPKFVRRFKSAQIIRRESVGAMAGDKAARQKSLEGIVIRAFNGDPSAQDFKSLFAKHNFAPPGVVIASVDDPAWTAAVALAAGHGQPLLWLDDALGGPGAELDDDAANKLAQQIEQLVKSTGYEYAAMGDVIDAVTICRMMPAKARAKLPEASDPNLPAGADLDSPIATSDFVCRNADGTRWGFAGWIWGDETRAAYMAMCSLFLPREKTWLFNTYPTTADWQTYGLDQAAQTLSASGFTVKSFRGEEADFASWRRMLPGGLSTDIVLLNSKGNNDFFDLYEGQGRPDDVPVLNEPVAISMIHSWSMQVPNLRETVGGRWLSNGAYAAVGSCWEPYLGAFVQPELVVNRCVSFVPFLVAARWWNNEGALWKPWRVVTIGDPLMLCAPPEKINPKRVLQSADYGVDLAQRVKDVMRDAQTDDSGKSFGEAIRMLDLLGKDDIAIQLWLAADQEGKGMPASRAALGPLFRARNVEQFMKAWEQLPARDDEAKDMLWHLYMPRLSPQAPGLDEDILMQMQSAIRQPMPWVDIERLGPHLAAKFGRGHVLSIIEREMDKLKTPGERAEMAKLLKQY